MCVCVCVRVFVNVFYKLIIHFAETQRVVLENLLTLFCAGIRYCYCYLNTKVTVLIYFYFYFATEGTKMLATAKDKDDGAPKSGEKSKHKTVVHQLAGVHDGVAADEIKLNPYALQLV